MHVLPMSTTRPWVMTDKNHTQKKIEKNFSTDVDVSDYGESKSAIKKIAQKKNPQATFWSREKKNLPYILYIYTYIQMYR